MRKRLFVFLELLIGGIILGIVEDIILIKILTNEPITWHIIWIIFLVTLPFAFFGELVIDKINFLKLFKLDKKYRKIVTFFQFLIFGIVLGVVEDLAAFYFAIGEPITFKVVLVAFVVAIPFAFIGEIFLDRISFKKSFKQMRIVWKKN